eukprot:m.84052 g.84052  ORF g.84052 m.84052 type:complete len:265 (+) comp14673_c0_seq1:154-948(+)
MASPLPLPLTPTEPRSPFLSRQGSIDALQNADENAEVHGWLSQYHQLPRALQQPALVALVRSLEQSPHGHHHLPVLRNAVTLSLQRDFLATLPEEVALNILRWLDPKSLLACCMVSKTWYKLAQRDQLWHPLYKLHYSGSTLVEEVNNHSAFDTRKLSWRQLYLLKGEVHQAWLQGQPETLPPLKGHTGVITCMERAGADTVVTGSDDGNLRVWSLSRHQVQWMVYVCIFEIHVHLRMAIRLSDRVLHSMPCSTTTAPYVTALM